MLGPVDSTTNNLDSLNIQKKSPTTWSLSLNALYTRVSDNN
jgi:hypothetical protein